MDDLVELVGSLPWVAWVAIVAIAIGGIASIVQTITRHLERTEKIRQGIDPDASKKK